MTTTVTIDAHAGWPVKVTKIDLDSDGNEASRSEETVDARTKADFHVHSTRELHIKEMPNG